MPQRCNRQSEQWKASLSFWGAIGLGMAIPGLMLVNLSVARIAKTSPLRFWQNAMACCQEILSYCHLSLNLMSMGLIWLSLVMLGTGFLYACGLAVCDLWKTHRFLRRLPVLDSTAQLLPPLPSPVSADSVSVFENDTMKWAFTAGLLRPRIYLSTGLIQLMTPEELKGVLLHEQYHCIRRDPLKMLLMSFLQHLFFFLPISRVLKGVFADAKEQAADAYAASHGGCPLELASALTKLAKSRSHAYQGLRERRGFPRPSTGMAGGGEIIARIGALLGKSKVKQRPPLRSIVVSIVACGLLFSVSLLPVFTEKPHSGCTAFCQENPVHHAKSPCKMHCASIQSVNLSS